MLPRFTVPLLVQYDPLQSCKALTAHHVGSYLNRLRRDPNLENCPYGVSEIRVSFPISWSPVEDLGGGTLGAMNAQVP